VPLPVLYKSTSAMLPVLSPLLLLAASPTLDEPALFLYGNKSLPLEVLNSSDLQLLSASRRLGTCHPSGNPKNHERPECRDVQTKSIVFPNVGRADCVCTHQEVVIDHDGKEYSCDERYWVEYDDQFTPAYNSSTMEPGICSPGHLFKCSDAPCCWGECKGQDINRYYRCYRKKVCVDPGCGCKCGPCWFVFEC
jgi:hypothetical protein